MEYLTEIEAVEAYLENLERLEKAELFFYNLDMSDAEFFDNKHWGVYFTILENCKKLYPVVKNFSELEKLAKQKGLTRYRYFDENKKIQERRINFEKNN